MSDLSGCRVFVIEDEFLLAIMLEDILRDLGCVVAGRATNLAEALAFLEIRSHELDAATLDLNLGGVSGRSVGLVLKARKIPFIITTGYSDQSAFTGLDDAPILRKPYTDLQVEQAFHALNLTCVATA